MVERVCSQCELYGVRLAGCAPPRHTSSAAEAGAVDEITCREPKSVAAVAKLIFLETHAQRAKNHSNQTKLYLWGVAMQTRRDTRQLSADFAWRHR